MQQVGSRFDPAPSKWAYRYHRLMLTPMFRLMLRIGLPFGLCFVLATVWLSDKQVQENIVQSVTDLRKQIEQRPEFMVKLLSVEGASDAVTAKVHEIFPFELPISSFDMELDDIRRAIEVLPAVASAAVRLRQGGVLEVQINERQPVALIRTRDGLNVVDIEGITIAIAPSRAARPDLPVIAGEGAEYHIAEALELRRAASPLNLRMRGLVRIGERRWDVVLDRDQRIMLPEENAVRALERVIVLSETQDLLERDIAAVDMRLTQRPTIRMRDRAVEEWWRVRNSVAGATDND